MRQLFALILASVLAGCNEKSPSSCSDAAGMREVYSCLLDTAEQIAQLPEVIGQPDGLGWGQIARTASFAGDFDRAERAILKIPAGRSRWRAEAELIHNLLDFDERERAGRWINRMVTYPLPGGQVEWTMEFDRIVQSEPDSPGEYVIPLLVAYRDLELLFTYLEKASATDISRSLVPALNHQLEKGDADDVGKIVRKFIDRGFEISPEYPSFLSFRFLSNLVRLGQTSLLEDLLHDAAAEVRGNVKWSIAYWKWKNGHTEDAIALSESIRAQTNFGSVVLIRGMFDTLSGRWQDGVDLVTTKGHARSALLDDYVALLAGLKDSRVPSYIAESEKDRTDRITLLAALAEAFNGAGRVDRASEAIDLVEKDVDLILDLLSQQAGRALEFGRSIQIATDVYANSGRLNELADVAIGLCDIWRVEQGKPGPFEHYVQSAKHSAFEAMAKLAIEADRENLNDGVIERCPDLEGALLNVFADLGQFRDAAALAEAPNPNLLGKVIGLTKVASAIAEAQFYDSHYKGEFHDL